jgi:hypothetical protein
VRYSPQLDSTSKTDSTIEQLRWHEKKRYRIPVIAAVLLTALVSYAIFNYDTLPSSESIYRAISERNFDEAEEFDEKTGVGFDSDWRLRTSPHRLMPLLKIHPRIKTVDWRTNVLVISKT